MSSRSLMNVLYTSTVVGFVILGVINGDDDYSEYDNGYFIGVHYHGSEKTSISWEEAELYCEINYGTNLASIHSELENIKSFDAAFGAGARPNGRNNLIWIGFHDIDNEGTFIWSDGSIIDYANWDYGEPNNFRNGNPGEDCTSVRSSLKWNDLPCDATLLSHTVTSFVCNKKWFSCKEQCNELTTYQDGCANNECLKDCANCVLDIAWDDYSGGQDVSCQCHENGCDQCRDGYFKIDYDFPCQSCDEFIGCSHCTDFYGCQQCKKGYELVEDDTRCGDNSLHNTGNVKIHYCKAIVDTPNPTPNPTPKQTPEARVICPNYNDYNYGECRYDDYCSNCQSWGCADCNDDYYKMGNFKRCQSCKTNYPNCRKCNDWNGCVECNPGYKLTWSNKCGDEVCVPIY